MSVHEPRTPAEHLLGSRARARVLAALVLGPGTVSELARASGCAKSATSAALRQLGDAGMTTRRGDRYAIDEAHRDLAVGIVGLAPAPPQHELYAAFIGSWIALSATGDVLDSDGDPEVLAKRLRAAGARVRRFLRVSDPNQPHELADIVWSIE